jgi:preprotein translocase subunit SecA
MRLFENLWNSIGEQVTDIVFRMEQTSDPTISRTFVETKAIHESAPSLSQAPPAANTEIGRQQQQAIENSHQQPDRKVEPIRHRGQKLGRNDPCHCGSGKKYKSCCMRVEEAG